MNKMSKVAVAIALTGVTASASAWWGGPFSGWGDDFFGDGWFNFSFSARASGHGWGRGYDYYGPYGYPYWGAYAPVYGYPHVAPVLSEEQLAAAQEQQKAFAEQQAQVLRQAVEAQRKLAEQVRQSGYDPLPMDAFASADPFLADPSMAHDAMVPASVKALIEQSDAEYEKVKAESKARREAFQQRVQERREAMRQRVRDFTPSSYMEEPKRI